MATLVPSVQPHAANSPGAAPRTPDATKDAALARERASKLRAGLRALVAAGLAMLLGFIIFMVRSRPVWPILRLAFHGDSDARRHEAGPGAPRTVSP